MLLSALLSVLLPVYPLDLLSVLPPVYLLDLLSVLPPVCLSDLLSVLLLVHPLALLLVLLSVQSSVLPLAFVVPKATKLFLSINLMFFNGSAVPSSYDVGISSHAVSVVNTVLFVLYNLPFSVPTNI